MAHDAHQRLDDLLTATTDYREELAREILSRVELLEGQMAAMSSAAGVLLGRPVEEERAPPETAEEFHEARERQVQALDKEIRSLRQQLAVAGEPLSQRLAETEAEVQEARDLAAKRDKELEAALNEVTRLEQEMARVKEQRDGLANSAIGLDPGEDRLAGEVMLKDNGPKGVPRPTFTFPKAKEELFAQTMDRMRERFRVYLLEDGSVLYKPTGIRAPEVGEKPPEEPARPAEPERPQEEVPEPTGLARSPKPVAEMRSNQRDSEVRLERIVRFLMDYDQPKFNSPDVYEDMGSEGTKASVGQDFRELEKRGILERTGEFMFPRAVAEARRLDPKKAGGRPAIEYRLAEEFRTPPSDLQATIRDYMIKSGEGTMVSPTQVAVATEMVSDVGAVLEALEGMVQRGVVEDKSPSPDMRLFAYAGKPKDAPKDAPKAAPKGNREDEKRASRGGGSGVAGTGKGLKAANKDVQDLINAARRAGARVAHEASGHFAVTIPGTGKRVLISSTPSNPRTVLNDRSRLRRAGLAIA